MTHFVGARLERARRALTVARVAQRSGLRRILGEIGVSGNAEPTRERAQAFRGGFEELGTTFIKLGQLLSSRPDLLPDVYIEELGRLVDDVPSQVPFPAIEAVRRDAVVARAWGRSSGWRVARAPPPSRSRPRRSRRRIAVCWPPVTTSCSR